MVCINCVVSYAQTYAPYILPLVLWFSRLLFKPKRTGGVDSPPVWGPWYLPPFVRGIMAAMKLGTDEDGFLLSAKATYGDAVYIPWPMKQVFVLSTEPIQHVYATSSKQCFYPIRTRMQHTVFGTSKPVAESSLLPGTLFPVHAKALTPIRIPEPTGRFIHEAKRRVEQLAAEVDANGGSMEINFVQWMRTTMFAAGTAALFGEDYSARAFPFNEMEDFMKYDDVFGLLAAEMIPPSLINMVPILKRGKDGQQVIMDRMHDWIIEGAPGLEEGDVIKSMVDLSNKAGTSPQDTATLIFSDFWALQANAPWAAVALLTFVIQSPILNSVVEEIDQLPVDSNNVPELDVAALDKMNVSTSCVHETMRLWTSSFSIRVNPEATLIPVSSSSSTDQDVKYMIEPGTKVICATRASHLTDEIWGDAPQQWDGTRFLKGEGEDDGERERKLRKVWGFGGGVSICEGRHLATCELKTMLALLLSTFELVPLHATAEDGKTPLSKPVTKLDIKGGKNAFAATRETTRPGLGAFQCKGKSDIVLRVTKRKL